MILILIALKAAIDDFVSKRTRNLKKIAEKFNNDQKPQLVTTFEKLKYELLMLA